MFAIVVVLALIAGGALGYVGGRYLWPSGEIEDAAAITNEVTSSSTTRSTGSTMMVSTTATGIQSPETPVLVDLSPHATIAVSETHPPDTEGGTVYYYPEYLMDGIPETCWSIPGKSGWVQFDLENPVEVSELRIIAGYQKETDTLDCWPTNNRLRRFRVEFADGTTEEHEVLDQRDWQVVSLQPTETTSVRIVILEVYPYQDINGYGWNDTNISEIHVWGY